MKDLTKAEEQIMQVLWQLEKAFVKELVAEMPDPKPAYNTVSTIVRILEEKGFIAHVAFGKTHQYFPKVSKDAYGRHTAGSLLSKYFNGSVKDLVSFFVKEERLDSHDLDAILKSIETKNEKS
jgi:BlaI family penicillinase repressor